MMNPAIYVAGTDTGVGKTHVSVALCHALRARGLTVGVFKPAETGCELNALNERVPADAIALLEASGSAASLESVCPYRLRDPLAPALAAKREGVEIDPEQLLHDLTILRDTHDVVICEGAGGLLVPLANGLLNIDWVGDANLPVLLVGRLGLGTINHTLLSVRALATHDIELSATLLSATEAPSSLAEQTNPDLLLGYPEVKFSGVIGYGEAILPLEAVEAVVKTLGME